MSRELKLGVGFSAKKVVNDGSSELPRTTELAEMSYSVMQRTYHYSISLFNASLYIKIFRFTKKKDFELRYCQIWIWNGVESNPRVVCFDFIIYVDKISSQCFFISKKGILLNATQPRHYRLLKQLSFQLTMTENVIGCHRNTLPKVAGLHHYYLSNEFPFCESNTLSRRLRVSFDLMIQG